ncbi:MAG: uracil-DNA glycosylase [Deltaproteobacteria bacterium]|nr:uracil-DNA glycosylase [Deltaproteobacteria bacterium]
MPNTLEQAKYELLLQARAILTELKSLGVDDIYLQPRAETLPICAADQQPSTGECRAETLAELQSFNQCQGCPSKVGADQKVFGEGNPHAQVVFVGERPTMNDISAGAPFSGEAGELLDKILLAMGLSRTEVYLCYLVKCASAQNSHATQAEVVACESLLQRQLAAIRPQIVVALGTLAAQVLLNKQQEMSHMRGTWSNYQNIPLIATFHPNDLIRNPVTKREVWDDMKQVQHRLKQDGLS